MCRTPAGCPKGTPENQLSLSPQNWLAFRHYRECQAVGYSPEERDDPIVRRNASLISAAESRKEKQDESDWRFEMLQIVKRRA